MYHAAFSPDGQRLVTTSQDNTARLWNLTPGRQEIVLKPHTNQMMDSYYAYATFSPDGQTVTTVSSTDWEGKDAEVRSWDVKTGKERMLISRQIPARYAKFSHDGTLLITTATNVVRIWDTKTTKQITILKQEYKYPYSDHIILSPDSQRLITISGNIANVWDIHTGKLLTALEGHKGGINDAVFSPDGQYIVTVSGENDDNTVRLWDTTTGQQVAILRTYQGSVNHAAFSPDGRYIVTASNDKTARLSEVKTGDPLLVFFGHIWE